MSKHGKKFSFRSVKSMKKYKNTWIMYMQIIRLACENKNQDQPYSVCTTDPYYNHNI